MCLNSSQSKNRSVILAFNLILAVRQIKKMAYAPLLMHS